MTVRLMEGFETTETIADLRARGSTVSSAAFGSMLPVPARYPQGKAMARSGGNQRFIDRPTGTLRELGGGAFLSISAMTTPYNSASVTIPTAVQTPHGWVHGVGNAGVNVTTYGTSVNRSGVNKQVANPSGNNQYNPFQFWYDADRDQIIGRYQYSSNSYYYIVNAATLTSAGQVAGISNVDVNASMVYVEASRPNILCTAAASIYVRQVGAPNFVQVNMASPNNITCNWAQRTPYGYLIFAIASREIITTTSPNANTGWGNRQTVPIPNVVQTVATNLAGARTIVSTVGGAVYVMDTTNPTITASELYLQSLPGTAPANTNVQYLDGNFYVFEIDNAKANGGTPTRYWTAPADVVDTTLTWTSHELESSKFFGGISSVTHAPGLLGEDSYIIINHVGGNVAFGKNDTYLTLVGGPMVSNNSDATGFFNGWSNTRLGLNAHNILDSTDPEAPVVMKQLYWAVSGPGQTTVSGTAVVNQPQTTEQWNNLELALTAQGNEQYQVDFTQDAVPVGSATFTYTPLTPHTVYTGGVALTGRMVATDDGTIYAAHAAPAAGRGACRSYNWAAAAATNWENLNTYSLANAIIGRIVTDGNVVLGFARSGGTAGSTVFRLDEPSPRILANPLSGSSTWNAADTDRKGLWMACSNIGSTSPVIWKSENDGNTWTSVQLPTVPTTVMVSEIVYGEDDTWCAFAYQYVFMTKDAGATWTWTTVYNVASPITGEVAALMPTSTEAALCSGCYGRGKFWYVTSYTRGQVLAIDPTSETPALAEVFRIYGSIVSITARSVAVTDETVYVTTSSSQIHYAQPGHSATGTGTTWPLLAVGAGSPNTVYMNENIAMTSSSATGPAMFYIESLLDLPLMVRTQVQSWAAVDDVVVTDMSAPNLGPVGETRIYVVPSDTDVGTPGWVRIPEELPTNAAAATSYPLSETTSRVEAADVGQRDVYGTTSFDYPAGLKPVAMSFEGNFGRLFTNTPVVELGMQVSGEEVTTGPVSITSPLGTTTFASKILDRNPNGNVSWSRDTIPDTELTLTKVG